MNEWNNDNPGENPESGAPNPEIQEQVPAPAPPSDNLGGFSNDLDDGFDEKMSGGNKGMLIAMVIFLLLAGVIGFLWWQDKQATDKWSVKFDAALEANKAGDVANFNASMRDILKNCPVEKLRADAAFNLGSKKDAEAVPLLIEAIKEGGMLGETAALSVAKIGSESAGSAADAINAQMEESTELRRAKYAWALVSLNDERGFAPLLAAVSAQIVNSETIEDFDSEVMTSMATTDRLIDFADSEDTMLRMYAAMELGNREDKDPVPTLLKLLKDKEDDVAREAAVSLGKTSDERAGSALLDKIVTDPDMLGPILTSIARSVGAPGLESIYKSTDDPAIKYKVIGKFKELKDPRSAKMLLSVLNEKFSYTDEVATKQATEIQNQALWILESLGAPEAAEAMYQKTQWEPISEEQIPDEAVRYRQDDMSRKIANGAVSWLGEVQPEGVADMLEKIYKENEPYSNTPECAKRVKVDIGPLMEAMGRVGDERFCKVVEPFLTKDENFYSQAATMALGRLKCPGVSKQFKDAMAMTATERKEEKFSTLIESRNWQMEGRLQERRNSIIASRYLGDASLAETLMNIALDPMDDPELRAEASNSLAYIADETAMAAIVEKVKDNELDVVARAALIKGLWHNPSKEAVEAMMKVLEGAGNQKFVKSAAIVVGEAGDASYAERLNTLLDSEDDSRKRGAVMAILLGGGNLDRLDRILEILAETESGLVLRDWYETHDVFLTQHIFDSKRIFKRLKIADDIARQTEASENHILWPWKHLMDRIDKGWETSPGGLTALQIRQVLGETVETDAEYRELAAEILRGLNERGILLAIAAGKGEAAEVAHNTVKSMNLSTR